MTAKRASKRKDTGRSPRPGSAREGSFARAAISIFIVFHLVAIVCWAVPWKFPPLGAVRELVRPYMLWSGLFQRWDMFAPTPPRVNTYVKAVVITSDRHLRVYDFPRMQQLGYAERYRKEKYRKFAEVLPDPLYQVLWPDVASHVARRFAAQGDLPSEVMLIQFRSDIPPMGAQTPEPEAHPSVFYEGFVTPGELK